MTRAHRWLGLVLALAILWGCAPGGAEGPSPDAVEQGIDGDGPALESALRDMVVRIDSAAASIDSIFQPLPLLTPADEESLRSMLNARQLTAARALGIERALPPDRLATLESEGRLIRLADTGQYVIRDLDHSQPLAVPGVHALLTEIGERFQNRLAELGAPPYRLEVTSVLRTAADQEALRRVNPNAAAGESTHEYGTTIDVLYSAFSAPREPLVPPGGATPAWTAPYLRRYEEIAAERVAGRRSLELKAILGQVLIEMQREGKVMITLERQQPVYHMTLAIVVQP